MLDRLLADVAEVILVCMVVVDVCDGREVDAWDIVLHDGEVSEVRHERVHDCSQRVCIMVL